MMKFLVILFGSAGGILLLIFLLSLVFSSQLALQPAGFVVAASGIAAILIAWVIQNRFIMCNISQ